MFAITAIAHPGLRGVREDCFDCTVLATDAVAHARVTGSTGATYTDDKTRVGGQSHSCTVARIIAVVQ